MKQKEKRIQGRKQEDSEGSEESKGGLDRCSVQGNRNLPDQKRASYLLVKGLTSEK